MTQYKILVADDDVFTLTSITTGLEEAGYEVFSASDGKSAVHLGLQTKPDLAVLDIRMPGKTGIEAARELKSRGGISTLFLSAYTDREVVERATREGALGYLVKPLNAPQLVPAIEAALKRSAELQQLQQKESVLTDAIDRNRQISMAMGIYMQRFSVDESHAFEAIRNYARYKQQKLAVIARKLVKHSTTGDSLIEAIHAHNKRNQ